jgi:hypothetical protein
MTSCVACKGIPSATPSATPKDLSTRRQISVDKKCYDFTRFGRQKASLTRKYGHDPLVVTFYALKDHECVARAKTSSGWVVTD